MVVDLLGFREQLLQGARLIGLDLGSKNIGIAISDTGRVVASPLATRRRTKFASDFEALSALAVEHAAGGFVVGLPLNMDGSEGPAAQSARAFARNVAARSDIPVLLWDERLSTAAVTRTLLDADMSRRRRSDLVDKLAAAWILQGALDALAHVAIEAPE